MLVGCECDEFLRVDAGLLGKRHHLLIREEKTIRESGPDRVTDVSLPELTAQWGVISLVGVLRSFADRQHTAHSDDHAPRLLRERSTLGVEEAERFLRTEGAEKRVEH